MKYPGRHGDLKWGHYNYPVTKTQKEALDGIWYMLSGLPRAQASVGDLPAGGFYSQDSTNGDVIIGLHHHSVTVRRSGRVMSNESLKDVFRVKRLRERR